MQAKSVKILNALENLMGIARYFQVSSTKNGHLVTATGREVVLRLAEGEAPRGSFVGPVHLSSENHRADQAGYRAAKAELISKIQASLPEAHELRCLNSKDEIAEHYKLADARTREAMRIQQEMPSHTIAFIAREAISDAERIVISEMFGLEADKEKPLVTLIMNDQFKVAAHVDDEITGSMLDATGTLRPWTAPEGSTMEQVIRNRFPITTAYAI
jgi:hypothetical protein